MSEQDELFSPNQLQLWKLAWWSKNLSIIVLVIYIFVAGFQILQFIKIQNNDPALFSQSVSGFKILLRNDPIMILNLGVNVAVVIVQGVVYYLVLQGVALGLSMVVETDINYREKEAGEDE